MCGFELLIFGAVFGLAWLASRASRDELLLRWRPLFIPLGLGYSVAIRLIVAFVLVTLATVLVLSGLITPQALQEFATANRPDVETLVDVSALRHNPLYFWLSVTVVSFVVAGGREELWRSAFLAGLISLWPSQFGSRLGQVLAVTIAAIIFGLGHLSQGVLGVGLTGCLGFVLGLIMVLHRSVWPAVIAHGAFDATSLSLLPWALDLLHKFHPG